MIRTLYLRGKLYRALAKRRRQRAIYSAASKRGAAKAIHNAFNRDVLIRERGLG